MTRSVVASVGLALVLDLSSHAAQGPNSLTSVSAVFETKDRNLVQSVTADDLEVLVDGTPRRVASVVKTAQPATVLLLIDVSSSATWGGNAGGLAPMGPLMGHDRVRLMSAMLRHVIPRLNPQDRLRIGVFGGRELVLNDAFTSSKDQQEKDLRFLFDHPRIALRYLAPSPIFDVVVAASRLLASEPEPRAIILVSDGEATGNRYGMSEAAVLAATLRVPVHVVCQDPNEMLKAPKGRLVLQPIAERTGGLFRADDKGVFAIEIAEYFRNIVDAIHATHTIQFATTSADAAAGPHAHEEAGPPGPRAEVATLRNRRNSGT